MGPTSHSSPVLAAALPWGLFSRCLQQVSPSPRSWNRRVKPFAC